MSNISRVPLLFFFIFFLLHLNAQQVSKINFTGVEEQIYVEALNKVYMKGYLDNFVNTFIYSYDLSSHQLIREDDFDRDDYIRVSPDQQFLYVSNAQNVTVYNLPDLSIAYQFTAPDLGSGRFRISPLDPNLIIVSNGSNLILYQNGVVLPNVFANNNSTEFIFSETKNMIYTKNNSSTANDLFALSFDANGFIAPDKNYFFHSDKSFLTLYKDKIYSLDGTVIDVTDPIPKLEGNHSIRLQNLVGAGAYVFSFDIISSYITLIDSTKNQVIQAGIDNSSGKLRLLYFDIETLRLMDNRVLEAPNFPSFFTRQYVQYADGANFMYFSGDELVIVNDQCNSIMPAPSLDPVFQSPVYQCAPEPIVVAPPNGYNALYDINNVKLDSLIIPGQGYYQFSVMDTQGCLSELSDSITVKASFIPSPPLMQELGDNGSNILSTVERCEGGKAYLQAIGSGNRGESFLWSTGEIDEVIEVENETEVWIRTVGEFGCMSENSDTVRITDSNRPTPEPPEILGDDFNTNICSASSVTLTGEEGYERYRWYNTALNYAVTSFTFTVNDEAQIFLQGENADGCWSDLTHKHVKEVQSIVNFTPRVSQLDNMLSSNSSASYFQWFLNDEIIPDSNNPYLNTTQSGIYHLRVGDGLCWSQLSDPITIP